MPAGRGEKFCRDLWSVKHTLKVAMRSCIATKNRVKHAGFHRGSAGLLSPFCRNFREKKGINEVRGNDLVLPLVLDGVAISWVSSEETVISNTGIVTQPFFDTEVTLTATLTLGEAAETKVFTINVTADAPEENDAELVDFYKYKQYSSEYPPWIEMIHQDENTVLTCTADKGHFSLYGPYIPLKNISVHSFVPVQWYFYEIGGNQNSPRVEQAFIEMVLKSEENIIGYAVIEAIWMAGPSHSFTLLKSVLFPQVDGEYQNVSEEYVKAAIEKVKEGVSG